MQADSNDFGLVPTLCTATSVTYYRTLKASWAKSAKLTTPDYTLGSEMNFVWANSVTSPASEEAAATLTTHCALSFDVNARFLTFAVSERTAFQFSSAWTQLIDL